MAGAMLANIARPDLIEVLKTPRLETVWAYFDILPFTNALMNAKEKQFVTTVRRHYKKQGRHDLPWKKTTDPYRILVSEIMLQQTQVERVLPKYTAFIKQWPTARTLTRASLAEVLRAWQGLGYNRRAKLLHECAKIITHEHDGKWPHTHAELMKLPGVGPYTAGAVMAFAFNQPVPIIETNIRTVYLHHFFKNQSEVPESALMQVITKTLDTKHPREWYWALMDYGSYLKKNKGYQNHQAKSYAKQSTFKGSDREIRGAIIRELSTGRKSLVVLRKLNFEPERIVIQLNKLISEKMVIKQKQVYTLPQ